MTPDANAEVASALEAMGPRPKLVRSDNEWLLIAYERAAFTVASKGSHLDIPDPIEAYGVLRREILRRMDQRP